MKQVICCLLVLLSLVYFIHGQQQAMRLKSFITDNMVIQRETKFCLGGGVEDNAVTSITVSLDAFGISQTATISADRDFSACFPAQKTGAQTSITFKAFHQQTQAAVISIHNVIFGDVYVCSGQSNMGFTVRSVYNATEEIAKANYPLIRIFTVRTNESAVPLKYAGSVAWQQITPTTIPNFSAACYFYGRDLHLALGEKIPIGLFATAYGGTPVEAWSTPESYAKCKHQSERVSLLKLAPTAPNQPTVLFNAMVNPFLSMRITGFTWYQGEANSGRPKEYECLFPAMIESWRQRFDNLNAPFYFVQLAAYYNGSFAEIRGAQAKALETPHTGMATAIDLGDPASPSGAIHPRNKQDVGKRLALIGRKFIYQDTTVTSYTGPQLKSKSQTSESGYTRITLQFDSMSSQSSQIAFGDTQNCAGCCQQTKEIQVGVQKASSPTTTAWSAPSDVSITGNTIHLSYLPQAGDKVVAIRYSWVSYAQCAIYNVDGLPATPFTSFF